MAEPSTFYALPEGQHGLFVGGGGSVRVPRLIGAHRMADMMLTGRVVDAQEGQALGLSHYLVGEGEGLAKALELAGKIATNSPVTNFAMQEAGRPVLVGTVSVEKSEVLSEMLKRRGIRHEVLNAKFHEKEAPIVAQAVRLRSFAAANPAEGFLMESLMAALAGSSEQAQQRMQTFLQGRGGKVQR